MAINTYKTALMIKGEGNTWEKLIDIKNYPDLGGVPEALETTTLSDKSHTYIKGIEGNTDSLEFTCNYDMNKLVELKALTGIQELSVWFGGSEAGGVFTPTGNDGKFTFKGYVSVYPLGGDVNAVREMNVVITLATPIEFEEE